MKKAFACVNVGYRGHKPLCPSTRFNLYLDRNPSQSVYQLSRESRKRQIDTVAYKLITSIWICY